MTHELRRAAEDHIRLLRDLAAAYMPTPPPTSVAVVGNAPLSPSLDRARRIDHCDAVFRVNGFAVDRDLGNPTVGNRAHVVLFNRALRASPHFFHAYRERLYLMVEPGRLHWEPETWPHWWPMDLGYIVVSNEAVTLPLSEALGLDSRAQALWATTGTTAAWLAAELFPDASLFLTGYSFIEEPKQTMWAHAWGQPSPVGPEHVIGRESAMLQHWIRTGRVHYLP